MYHVTLNGQGYLIDLGAYVRRAFEPFALKRAQGARSYGDLRGPEQVHALSDWSGGEGQVRYGAEAPARYRAGDGIDVWSVPGGVRLGPELTAKVTPGSNESGALCIFNGHLIVGDAAGNVYRFNGTTATLIGNVGGAVRSLETFLGKLYVGREGSGAVAEITSAWAMTAAKFTVTGSPAGVYSMRTFYRQTAQYLYVLGAANGPGSVGTVQWWDGATLSPIQYDFEQVFPLASAVLGNRLYFFVSDLLASRLGVYSVDDGGSGGVYRHHLTVDGVVAWEAVVYQGAMYVLGAPDGRIFKWDGSSLTQVYQLATPAAPYGAALFGAAQWQGALWIGIADGAGGLGLLRYDGTSWSRPVSGLTGTALRKLQVFNGALYAASARVGAGTVYGTTGALRTVGTLETALFDAGLPNVLKVLRSVTVVHAPLATGQSVQVQYRVEDAGGWVTLGTSSGLGQGAATFTPAGSQTCRQVGVRLTLVGPGGGSTPVIYDVLVRYAPAPPLAREWELAIMLAGTPELPLVRLDGSAEPLTGQQLASALWSARELGTPVIFSDLDDASRRVWIDDIREETAKYSQRQGFQSIARVRLVEAG